MANAFYLGALGDMMKADLDLEVVTLKLVLVDSTYTFDATHGFLDSIAASAREATQTLTTVSVTVDATAAVLNADDTVFTGLTGDAVVAGVVYEDTGTESTSRLVCYIDDIDTTPDGTDRRVEWSSGKVFGMTST